VTKKRRQSSSTATVTEVTFHKREDNGLFSALLT